MIKQNQSRLIVYSNTNTAVDVTRALGITPHEIHEVGDPRASSSSTTRHSRGLQRWQHSSWILEFEDEGNTVDESGTGSLVALLNEFAGKAELLRALPPTYRVELSWWGTSDSAQGGLVIGAETMRRVVELGCDLYMTVYPAEGE